MKKRTGYVLPVAIMIMVLCVLIYMAVSRPTDVVQTNNNKDYDVVMALDFSAEYPSSPDKVLDGYNQIERFLSGNLSKGFTDEELKALLEKQRQLFDIELLSINTLDNQLKGYKEKLNYLEEVDIRIIQITGETPIFSEDAKRCTINAKQYWSKHIQVNVVYNMKKDQQTGNWKIAGWYVNEEQQSSEEG